jgi:hypothetical protein
MPEKTALPLVFHASKRKMLAVLAGSLAFVAGSLFVLDKEPVTGYLGLLFFGLCAVVGAVSLHPRASYLELTEQGFAFASLFRRASVPWRDVQGFVTVRIQLNHMVGWNYVPGFQGAEAMRKASTALAGVQAALPDTYGMSAEALAALLNDFRSRYGV